MTMIEMTESFLPSVRRTLEDSDPCAPEEITGYDQALHIGSIFILFVASASGVAVPLLPKYNKTLKVNTYWIVLGKCAGCGVMLSCALVHMILPSTEALTSPCLSSFWSETYPAFSFLFALMAALVSHLVEYLVESFIAGDVTNVETLKIVEKPVTGSAKEVSLHYPPQVKEESGDEGSPSSAVEETGVTTEMPDDSSLSKKRNDMLVIDESDNQQLVEAKQLSETLLVEFSLSVHSIFIGLALGTSTGGALIALLIALIFHQLLEGVALGCRLADSNLGFWNEFLFGTIFAISAPIGTGIGVGLYSTMNTNGQPFLLVSGIFDGVCGGLLLYNGFLLLLIDFSRDMEKHTTGGHHKTKVFGMFAALWIAALAMAIIGAWA